MTEYYTYDIETYPNCFTFAVTHYGSGDRRTFEISDRKSELPDLLNLLDAFMLSKIPVRLVGFNNEHFDYPVVHWIIQNRLYNPTAEQIYAKAKAIIDSNDRFGNMIWENERFIEQVDLFKIHHFDNVARATSLKVLEINMRMNDVRDLPFPVGTVLTDEQKDILIEYNDHDVDATELFLIETIEAIEMRDELSLQYSRNFLNFNDTKVGKEYFIMRLEDANPGICFDRSTGRKQPRQTIREQIALADVILPYVKFDNPEFNAVLTQLKNTTITETKGVFKDLIATVSGLTYHFSTGGLHAALPAEIFRSDNEHVIEMRDVTSYYPTLAIANRVYPQHLGEMFCDIYDDIFQMRKPLDKKSPQSKMLKLALNGVYGDSNNKYSPFYDPQYTMTITINGQMLLAMLAEQLTKIPGLRMINVNTDGVGYVCPREHVTIADQICNEWENLTKLELEKDVLKMFAQKDVNNYIAVYKGGSVKRKGAYEYKRQWHQNHSAMIVPKAVEAELVHGVRVENYINACCDPFDFCLKVKVPRADKLLHGDVEVQGTSRYFVSTDGKPMTKISPPRGPEGQYKRKPGVSDAVYNEILGSIPPGTHDERIHTKNKSTYQTVRTGIEAGRLVTLANSISDFNWNTLDRSYYIAEARKLVDPLK